MVPQDTMKSSEEATLLDSSDEEYEQDTYKAHPSSVSRFRRVLIATKGRLLPSVLCLSLCVNCGLLMFAYRSQSNAAAPRSQYAHLADSQDSQPWTFRSEWYSHNRTSSDAMWETLDFNAGFIALTDSEAAAMDLPESQRFPWDQSKGIYLINAYHNLHCLKSLWRSLGRFRDGKPFEQSDWHNFHCIDTLRQDTVCNADDTPRYSGGNQSVQSTGAGQTRHCRDWDKLEQWAKERSACYRYLYDFGRIEDPLDLYKFCPAGARGKAQYEERIVRLFGESEWQRLEQVYGIEWH